MTASKVCRLCKVEKPLSAFHPNKVCSQGVVGTCKECYKPRIKAWYDKNSEQRRQYSKDKNRARKKLLVEHFGNQCLDCKKTFPQYVYEFHHLDPSKKDVNPSGALVRSEKNMWAELSKCVMLCSNCHKIRHHGQDDEEQK